VPDRVQALAVGIESDTRKIVGSNERTRNALFRPAPEVALRLTSDEVVADLRRRLAVQMGGSVRRAAARVTHDGELLVIRIVGRGVLIEEWHDQAAVWHWLQIRPLVDVT